MWRKLPLGHISPLFRGHPKFARKTVRTLCSGPISEVPYETLQDADAVAPKSVPSHADAVIIGGGSIGCNTLYHLTKLGMTNVVLLEKDQLTAGTTWHTAGLVWNLRPSDTDIELLNYTRHLLSDVLEEETGVNSGWIQNGGLFIANNKERLDEYKRLATIGKVFGIESHVLSPEETKQLYPLMNTDDLYGTLYSPSDGTVDPAGFCTALSRAATKAGAKVVTNCAVTDITAAEDDMGVKRVQAVVTEHGTINTPIVINCGGVWATNVSSSVGVSTPLIGMRHAYVVTERIEGIENMPNVRDHDASVYLKLQGDGLSVGGYEPDPIFWEEVKDDFAFSLFDLDWDVFSVHIEGAVNRVPVIENTGVKSTVCGPESFTPDHKPLMGESPEVRGFYLGCGFNSSGMMFGGGCGRELARWVYHGRPELDMYGYDIRRFARFLTNNPRWIKERSHEAYAKNYSMVFPHDEPLASRNMRKDALHEELEAAGCVFQERLGWERPGWFSPSRPAPLKEYDFYGSYDVERHTNYEYEERLMDDYTFDFPVHHHIIGKECLATRNNAAAFNMSYFGKFYMVGPDAQKAADWIFTNDMTKAAGSTSYTCMLNRAGGIESDLTVSPIYPGSGGLLEPQFEGRGFYVAAGGGNSEHSLTHINTTIQDQKFNCKVLDHSADMCMLSVQGPKSVDILQALTSTNLSNENFPFSTHQIITLAEHKLRALRLTFVGELGWELHMPNEVAVAVYRAIMQEGEQYGIVNAGYRAIESLSIEKGYRHWHADLRSNDTPLEGGLAFTCKLKTNTPFLGRDALEKQKAEGIRKKIACFTVDAPVPLLGLETIYRNGDIVGFIRRGDYGFHIQKSIGYGYIERPDGAKVTNAFVREGQYTIERMGEFYPAEVHLKSPFDPENKRVQGNYEESASIEQLKYEEAL